MNAIRKICLPSLAVLLLATVLPSGYVAPEVKATEAHRTVAEGFRLGADGGNPIR